MTNHLCGCSEEGLCRIYGPRCGLKYPHCPIQEPSITYNDRTITPPHEPLESNFKKQNSKIKTQKSNFKFPFKFKDNFNCALTPLIIALAGAIMVFNIIGYLLMIIGDTHIYKDNYYILIIPTLIMINSILAFGLTYRCVVRLIKKNDK